MRRLFLFLSALLGVGLVWRVLSQRTVLPCPWWLSVLLENPVMDSVASARIVLDRAQVGEGMNVLDVGCGPGRVALAAAERVGGVERGGAEGRVVALDVQPRMLQEVRRRGGDKGLRNLETVLAGAGTGALDAHRREAARRQGEGEAEGDKKGEPLLFDAAFLITVLGEIPNRHAALAEIHRALKPGGVLSVTELLPDPHFQSRRTVVRLAEATGFEIGPFFGYRGAYTLHLVKPAD